MTNLSILVTEIVFDIFPVHIYVCHKPMIDTLHEVMDNILIQKLFLKTHKPFSVFLKVIQIYRSSVCISIFALNTTPF